MKYSIVLFLTALMVSHGATLAPSKSPSSKPTSRPTYDPLQPAALPVCLYGSGCRSNADCIRGSKCYISSPFYSQCILDTTTELKSNCVRDYAPGCGDGKSVCCNPGFSCNEATLSCVPVPAPLYCSSTLKTATPPTKLKFTLVLTRGLLNGKDMLLVNGTVPGPAIHLVQGYLAEITVINQLPRNESVVIHWHGQNQNKSTYADGIPDITQCVIPHPESKQNVMVYTFMPNDAGTFWYHGHYNEQYEDGLYGPLIIDATPKTPAQIAEADKWTWMVADWYNVPAHSLLPAYLSPASGGNEPTPDAFVVNNKYDLQYSLSALAAGPPVLVRVINAAGLSMYKVSVDGLPLQVVEIDGQPVNPFMVPYFNFNVAQRVSFYLDFSKLDKTAVAGSSSIYFRFEGIPEMYPTYDPVNLATLGIVGSSSGVALNLLWR